MLEIESRAPYILSKCATAELHLNIKEAVLRVFKGHSHKQSHGKGEADQLKQGQEQNTRPKEDQNSDLRNKNLTQKP